MPFWYFVPIPELPWEVSHPDNTVEMVKYLAREGSTVKPGTPIALVKNWWAEIQIEATSKGFLKKTFFDPHTFVGIGDPIAIIAADGEDMPHGRANSLARIVKIIREKPANKSHGLKKP